jgi:hypothetical protein
MLSDICSPDIALEHGEVKTTQLLLSYTIDALKVSKPRANTGQEEWFKLFLERQVDI